MVDVAEALLSQGDWTYDSALPGGFVFFNINLCFISYRWSVL